MVFQVLIPLLFLSVSLWVHPFSLALNLSLLYILKLPFLSFSQLLFPLFLIFSGFFLPFSPVSLLDKVRYGIVLNIYDVELSLIITIFIPYLASFHGIYILNRLSPRKLTSCLSSQILWRIVTSCPVIYKLIPYLSYCSQIIVGIPHSTHCLVVKSQNGRKISKPHCSLIIALNTIIPNFINYNSSIFNLEALTLPITQRRLKRARISFLLHSPW